MPNSDMKILVVDDFSTMRRIIRGQLKELGYGDIHEADNGSTALAALRKGGFEFVVADWNMPEMSGIEMLRAMRADNQLKSIPVLMITAEAKREQIIEAVQTGVNGYVLKPFTAQTLKEKIDKIFP